MSKKVIQDHKKGLIIPTLSVMLVAVAITVIQIQKSQFIKSRAASPIINCTVADSELNADDKETALLQQINTYRQQNGRQPLTWNPDLTRAATWLSKDMLARATLDHTDSLGRATQNRLSDCGLSTSTGLTTGENLYQGQPDPTTTFNAWKGSQPHNANMLNPNFNQAGISYAVDSTGLNSYWTLDLAGNTSATGSPTPSTSTSPNPTGNLSITPTPTLDPFPPSGEPSVTYFPSITPIPTLPSPTPTVPNGPTPTTDPNFGKTPFDMQGTVTVKFPSIGSKGNLKPMHLSRKVGVGVFTTNNVQVASGAAFLQYDGSNYFKGLVHFGLLPNAYYYIKIQGDQTLVATVQPIFQPLYNDKLNIMPAVTLVQGDFNGDNTITIDDYNLALTCFQDKKCQTTDMLDLNDDGKTDVIDYNVFLQSFWQYLGD